MINTGNGITTETDMQTCTTRSGLGSLPKKELLCLEFNFFLLENYLNTSFGQET
jgi:hypothetical protein